MLRGSARAKVDEKGRLKLPAVFRAIIEPQYGRDFFVTSFRGESVRVYPMDVWTRIEERLSKVKVLPTFRPDRSFTVDKPDVFKAYLSRLGDSANMEIKSYSDLLDALGRRHDFFHSHGCRLSDHGLEAFPPVGRDAGTPDTAFKKAIHGDIPSPGETAIYVGSLLHDLALMDNSKGWVQQYHVGAVRNTNTRMFAALGPDTGFDTIGDVVGVRSLSRFLDGLERDRKLAQTILYNLHPSDTEAFAALIGNFQDGTIPGKIQYGAAWWFLDQLDGMERQINALSTMGLLSQFVGMLTDSRSFLSYSRHEYFRRLLCRIFVRAVQPTPGAIDISAHQRKARPERIGMHDPFRRREIGIEFDQGGCRLGGPFPLSQCGIGLCQP